MNSTRKRALLKYVGWVAVLAVLYAASEASAAPVEQISWSGYATILKAYVEDSGMVDYRELHADKHDLDELTTSIGSLHFPAYERWSEVEQIAFWINAYNAIVLKAAAENYSDQGSAPGVGRSPGSGITRDYGRIWDRLRFKVFTLPMTLETIQIDQLAPFKEPRVHLALAPATLGGPPLRREPYDASRLNEQLDDQAKRFLNDSKKFRIDRAESKVYLSSIFQWYGSEFVAKYRPEKLVPNRGEVQSSVINFIGKYIAPADREYLEKGEYSISYISYDWALNEKK